MQVAQARQRARPPALEQRPGSGCIVNGELTSSFDEREDLPGLCPDELGAPGQHEVLGAAQKALVDRVWLNEPRDAYRDATLQAFRALALELVQS